MFPGLNLIPLLTFLCNLPALTSSTLTSPSYARMTYNCGLYTNHYSMSNALYKALSAEASKFSTPSISKSCWVAMTHLLLTVTSLPVPPPPTSHQLQKSHKFHTWNTSQMHLHPFVLAAFASYTTPMSFLCCCSHLLFSNPHRNHSQSQPVSTNEYTESFLHTKNICVTRDSNRFVPRKLRSQWASQMTHAAITHAAFFCVWLSQPLCLSLTRLKVTGRQKLWLMHFIFPTSHTLPANTISFMAATYLHHS